MQERVYEKRVNDVDELCMTLLYYLYTHLTFQASQSSAATDLRWGENVNKFLFLFRNSLLYITVKKITKIGQYLSELSKK